MKIEDYFSGLERSLRRIKGAKIHSHITCLASDDFNGLLRCRVSFWNGSYLDIYEVINAELGYPIKVHHAYTYMQDENRIFRYDNAPHHPEISSHPHHKHIGAREALSATQEPTLSQIPDEIETMLKNQMTTAKDDL